jgi:hypothetical protein
MLNYLAHILNSFSQLGNSIIGGHSNESLSGRAFRQHWKIMNLINKMFWWQNNHCRSAYMNDVRWAKDLIKTRSLSYGGA